MKNKITGLGTALITPFNQNEEVDYECLGNLIEFQIENNVDFLCVLGTTAETPTLTAKEKEQIIEFSIEKINHRVPILLGCSSNNTKELAKEIKEKSKYDIDALLSVVPYYNKPTQQGIYSHYKYISEHTDKGIIMYNVPSRTGVNMSAETALKISYDCKNIIGVKEASGNIHQADEIIENKREGFTVLSGDDALTYPVLTLGADGAISVIANCLPKLFAEMIHSARNNDLNNSLRIHRKLFRLYDLLFKDGNPAGVKAALNIKGKTNNILRLPLVPVSDSTYGQIKDFIDNFED